MTHFLEYKSLDPRERYVAYTDIIDQETDHSILQKPENIDFKPENDGRGTVEIEIPANMRKYQGKTLKVLETIRLNGTTIKESVKYLLVK